MLKQSGGFVSMRRVPLTECAFGLAGHGSDGKPVARFANSEACWLAQACCLAQACRLARRERSDSLAGCAIDSGKFYALLCRSCRDAPRCFAMQSCICAFVVLTGLAADASSAMAGPKAATRAVRTTIFTEVFIEYLLEK